MTYGLLSFANDTLGHRGKFFVHQALIQFTDGYVIYFFVLLMALVFSAATLALNHFLAPKKPERASVGTETSATLPVEISYPHTSFRILFNTLNLSLILVLLIPVSIHFKQQNVLPRAVFLFFVFVIIGLCFAYLSQRVRQSWRQG